MLHLFQVVVDAGAPWYLVLLAPLVPILSGWLAKLLADGLKQVLPAYDAANSTLKLVISLAIGAVIGFVNAHLALPSPLGTDPHGWTADVINVVLTVLAQSGIYRVEKNKVLAMQGYATKEQAAHAKNPAA